MKDYSYLGLLVILFLYSNLVLAQNIEPDPVIAKVGTIPVYQSELRERYEFLPQIGRESTRETDSLANEILYTIIAEKLWSLEAQNIKLDTLQNLKNIRGYLEKLFLRDVLYRKHIIAPVQLSDQELIKGVVKYANQYTLKYLYAPGKKGIDSLYQMLKSGTAFDSLLKYRSEKEFQKTDLKYKFGDFDETIEDSIYKLSAKQFSSPIYNKTGWYIFYAANIKKLSIDSIYSDNTIVKDIRKIIRKRKENNRFAKYFNDFLKDIHARVNGHLFQTVLSPIQKLISIKKESAIKNNDSLITINYRDFVYIKETLGEDILKSKFIIMPGDDVTVEDFIGEFSYFEFDVPVEDSINIAARFNDKIKTFIEHELLYREAIKENLDQSEEFKKSMNVWGNYLLGVSYKNYIYNKETPDDSVALAKYLNDSKLNNENASLEDFKYVKDSLITQLKDKYPYQKLIEKTISLGNKFGVEINRNLIKQLTFSNINFVVYRYFGFGGKMLAVPLNAPFAEWYNIWRKERNDLP